MGKMALAVALVGITAFQPAWAGATKSPRKGRIIYTAGTAWKVQETTVMAKMDMGAGVSAMPLVSRAVMNISVEKVFSDGSALVSQTPLSCSKGDTVDTLKDAPLPGNGKTGYTLRTRDGKVFLVQGKMVFSSPEEEMMMGGAENIDEVALLRESKTTAKFLKVMRNKGQLDCYRIPAKAGQVGAKSKMEGYAVVRLKNESVNGAVCEVYRAALAPMMETCWFDSKAGRVIKRSMTQGNPVQVEITQEVIK